MPPGHQVFASVANSMGIEGGTASKQRLLVALSFTCTSVLRQQPVRESFLQLCRHIVGALGLLISCAYGSPLVPVATLRGWLADSATGDDETDFGSASCCPWLSGISFLIERVTGKFVLCKACQLVLLYHGRPGQASLGHSSKMLALLAMGAFRTDIPAWHQAWNQMV